MAALGPVRLDKNRQPFSKYFLHFSLRWRTDFSPMRPPDRSVFPSGVSRPWATYGLSKILWPIFFRKFFGKDPDQTGFPAAADKRNDRRIFHENPRLLPQIFILCLIYFSLPITYYSIFLPKFAHTIRYKKPFISEKERIMEILYIIALSLSSIVVLLSSAS